MDLAQGVDLSPKSCLPCTSLQWFFDCPQADDVTLLIPVVTQQGDIIPHHTIHRFPTDLPVPRQEQTWRWSLPDHWLIEAPLQSSDPGGKTWGAEGRSQDFWKYPDLLWRGRFLGALKTLPPIHGKDFPKILVVCLKSNQVRQHGLWIFESSLVGQSRRCQAWRDLLTNAGLGDHSEAGRNRGVDWKWRPGKSNDERTRWHNMHTL